MAASSYSFTDLYPGAAWRRDETPTATTGASGSLPPASDGAVSISWIGLIAFLVILRVLFELAK